MFRTTGRGGGVEARAYLQISKGKLDHHRGKIQMRYHEIVLVPRSSLVGFFLNNITVCIDMRVYPRSILVANISKQTNPFCNNLDKLFVGQKNPSIFTPSFLYKMASILYLYSARLQ